MTTENVLNYINKILNDHAYKDYQKKQCESIQNQFSNAIDTFNDCFEFIKL